MPAAALSAQDTQHIFERLREGTVPERGLDAFAVGTEAVRGELERQFAMVSAGEGASKFLRGDYGCGKTFMAQLTLLTAIQKNFAVSKVVVSPNDTPFYKFDEVYARIVGNLQTGLARGGALGDCIDRWITAVEDRLIAEGGDEDSLDFDDHVAQRFEQELHEIAKLEAGSDFIAVLRAYFRLRQAGELAQASQLLSWLSGSRNVAAWVKRTAGIKGDISSQTALTWLKGILLIIRRAGHPGLLVVVDELETVMRMRADVREKSLNALRQILDAVPEYRGLFWLFTGTPDFFDGRRGVAGLPPLHDRIHFRSAGEFINLRQPQIELKPFDRARLREVALSLRRLYPGREPHHIQHKVSDAFIQRLIEEVTQGFKGDVGIIPRQFLREFVDVLDLVDQYPAYDPETSYRFTLKDLSFEEEALLSGQPLNDDLTLMEF